MQQTRIATILDYGCGKNSLAQALATLTPWVEVRSYDPNIEEYAELPAPAELVVCTDVLEHIEPVYLGEVLKHLASLAGDMIYLAIHTGPAVKELPDGRNAHLIQEGPAYWLRLLEDHWQPANINYQPRTLLFLGATK